MTPIEQRHAISSAILAAFSLIAASANATDYFTTINGNVPPVTLNAGDTVTVAGNNTAAVYANGISGGVGKSVVVNGGVTLTNTNGTGLGVASAMYGGSLDLGTGTVIHATGSGSGAGVIGATGIYARYSSGGVTPSITARDVTVTATSDKPYGIYAHADSSITLTGLSTVTTHSNGTEGWALVASTNGLMTAEDVSITMDGISGAYGRSQLAVSAFANSKITVTGQITADVTGLTANRLLHAGGAGSEVSVQNISGSVTSTAVAGTAYGLSAITGGKTTVNGHAQMTVNAPGDGLGIYASSSGEIEVLGSADITVNAENAYGIVAVNGNHVTLNNTILTANGNTLASAIYSESGSGMPTSVFTISNSTLNSSGDGIIILSGTNTIDFNNVTLNNASGIAINVARSAVGQPAGELDLTADASRLTGISVTEAGSTLNLTLQNGSLWSVTGNANLSKLINQNSDVVFSAPSAGVYKTLTVEGDYTGNNGRLTLNTWLGDDSSPTDKLIVHGNTSGNTFVTINPISTGALTRADGIQVVQVGGVSNGNFVLQNRLVTGAYEYDLYHGGVGANASDGNWYLRSISTPGGTPSPRPETGVYLRNMAAASTMFMHTLHDRLGEPQFTDTHQAEGTAPAVWVRVSGSRTESQAGNGLVDMDTDTTLVHFGGDLARWSQNGNDRWHIGLMGAYGRSETDADAKVLYSPSGLKRTASGKVDGYSAGAYATWYANADKPRGPYVDLWAQYGWYDNKVRGNGQKEESYDSTGWTVSVEGGYAFVAADSERRQWMIEPQAQIAYNSYSADDHRELNGTRVRGGDTDGVIARVGARFYSRSKLNDNGIQPFIEANWWYSDAKNTLMFNDTEISDDTPDNRYELKAGLQGEIAKGWQAWGHIGGQWGDNSYSRYEGMIGLKKLF